MLDEGFVINSSELDQAATNNPNRGYTLSAPFANLLKTFGISKWEDRLFAFVEIHLKAKEELERKRALERIPVTLPSGVTLELSTGEHNLLQKKIVEDFLSVHSSNPMNDERVRQLKQLVADCRANVVFVTAFLSKAEGLKHLKEIAWETEVWFANEPNHMMHLNGYKFLEIYK